METYRVFIYNASQYIPALWEMDYPHRTDNSLNRDFVSLDEACAFAKEVARLGFDFAIFRISMEEQDG